jgi:hypothetical protein
LGGKDTGLQQKNRQGSHALQGLPKLNTPGAAKPQEKLIPPPSAAPWKSKAGRQNHLPQKTEGLTSLHLSGPKSCAQTPGRLPFVEPSSS